MARNLTDTPLALPVTREAIVPILVQGAITGYSRIIFRCQSGVGFHVFRLDGDTDVKSIAALVVKLNEDKASAYTLAK